MPERHCRLSPSAAHRFLKCPGSARIIAAYRDVYGDQAGLPARQGTLAHKIGELELGVLRQTLSREEADREEREVEKNPDYTPELSEMAKEYARTVWQYYREVKDSDPILLLEQEVHIPIPLEDGGQFDLFGTADAIICCPDFIHILDFKSGQVKVNTSDEDFILNPQLAIYAVGAVEKLKSLYPVKTVTITVIQPKCGNSSVTIPIEDLEAFRTGILEPGVINALEGRRFKAGKHCRYCPIIRYCPQVIKEAEQVMSEEEIEQFEDLSELPAWRLKKALVQLMEFDFLAADIKEELKTRIQNGGEVEGFTLKAGARQRKWQKGSEQDVIMSLMACGVDAKDCYQIKSVSAIEGLLKKSGQDVDVLDKFITIKQNAPSLKQVDEPTAPERVKTKKITIEDVANKAMQEITPPDQASKTYK